jgi:hypothetical protein
MRTGSKLRLFSWTVGALSVLLPGALLTYQLAQFNKWAEAQHGFVCGMPVLAMWLLALVSCAILSCLASVLNGVHLFRSRPVSARRYIELGVIAAPSIAGLALVLVATVGP